MSPLTVPLLIHPLTKGFTHPSLCPSIHLPTHSPIQLPILFIYPFSDLCICSYPFPTCPSIQLCIYSPIQWSIYHPCILPSVHPSTGLPIHPHYIFTHTPHLYSIIHLCTHLSIIFPSVCPPTYPSTHPPNDPTRRVLWCRQVIPFKKA